MQHRPMGSLGSQVSALGFGAMRLPTSRRLLVKTVDAKEAIETIRMGIDRGISYVDTAWPYHLGRSETIVGEALRDGYLRVVLLYRSEKEVLPEALYKAGKCFEKAGQASRAEQMRNELKKDFSASPWAQK